MKRLLLPLTLIAAASPLLAQGLPPAAVQTGKVERRLVKEHVSGVATVEPWLRTVLSAEIAGLVKTCPLREGSPVTAHETVGPRTAGRLTGHGSPLSSLPVPSPTVPRTRPPTFRPLRTETLPLAPHSRRRDGESHRIHACRDDARGEVRAPVAKAGRGVARKCRLRDRMLEQAP